MEKCDFGTTLTLGFMQYMKTRRKQCKTANDLRVRDIRAALLFWHIEEQLINHEQMTRKGNDGQMCELY